MELAEREECRAKQGAALLGTGTGTGCSLEHPNQSTNCTSKKRKIIAGVALITLLAVILAVIFVLKLHHLKDNTCKNRCFSRRRNSTSSCYCDAACVQEGDCCLDYKEVCVQPSHEWTCSKFRCDEERLPSSLCSCAADCGQKGDCCTNYYSMCKGEKAWLEEECDDIKTPQCPESFSKSPLILISMDGFRAEYLNVYGGRLPAINKLRKCGTSTKFMRPAYPSKTFPNHYTIVTGLYPESHGIVDNKMYDVNHNAFFSLKGIEKFNAFWYNGEPVWLTAMNNSLKTGTFFWPGSDVPIKGQYPNFYKKYNGSVPFEMRVMTVLKWLSLPQTERPDFYTLYFEEPDRAGHRYGPMSSEVAKVLLEVDRIMQMIMDGLKQRKLHRCVNLVLLSDHGMEEASCTKAAYVSSYQNNTDDFIVIQGPAARIRPKRLPEEFFTFGYEELVKNLSCKVSDQPMRPYLKEHLPKRLHFASSIRIERAHLYMKSEWQAALKPNEVKYCSGGFHGSDNVFKNMQAIFIGYGPGLKYNTTVAPFENIEVYNLLCEPVYGKWVCLDRKHYKCKAHTRHMDEDDTEFLYIKSDLMASGGTPSANNMSNLQADGLQQQETTRGSTLVYQERGSEAAVVTDLLAIPPAPNNGTPGSLNHLLRNPYHHPAHPPEVSSASICSTHGTDLSPNDDLGCFCRFHNKSEVEYLNQRLITSNLTAKRLHLPYGVPRVLQANADYCMLHHSSYISGYSKDILMPLWVAYSLEPLSDVQPLSSSQEVCVRADVRIPAGSSQSCNSSEDNPTLTYGFLHPPNLTSLGAESDSLITSNMAPMFTVFKGIWDYFHNDLLVKYSKTLNGINVMSGPIFDKDFDGKYDIMKWKTKFKAPLPTHFFVILTSCKNSSVSRQKCDGPIETVSFILPHRPDTTEMCAKGDDYSWVEDWTRLHVARIRDVELLTGLSFYPDLLPVEDALQLKTFLKTFGV